VSGQRRYRLWNYLLAYSLAAVILGIVLTGKPGPVRSWPSPSDQYATGVAEGFPRFVAVSETRPWAVVGRTRVTDAWIVLAADPHRYRCHANLRVPNCARYVTGGVLRQNDRVRIAYLEDRTSGDRYITSVRGRALVIRCDPTSFPTLGVLGLHRPCKVAERER